MTATEKRQRLRAILAGRDCVGAASVWDPISARLADRLGIDIGLMGGSIASFTVLGAPDVIVLTLSELAEQVRRACRASHVALVVDADHGYGNSLNVMRTVEELEHAGAAGLCIEDTLLPRAFGSTEKPALIALAEGVAKIRAAVAARRDPSLVVMGRTSAFAITSLEDAVARLKAYETAGADGLFVPGLRTRAELERIAGATTLPLMIGAPAEALADPDYLASRRARLWSRGHQSFAAAVAALERAMRALRDGAPGKLNDLASKELMEWVTRGEEFAANARRYLHPG